LSSRHEGARVEVRRAQDDELEGYVQASDAGWRALTVFGGLLATVGSAHEATEVVHGRGLSSLAERWFWWSRASRTWRVVVPQEASPRAVRVAIGNYSLPGVDTAVITLDDLAAGDRLVMTLPAGEAPSD
jgi:hypothetical protein